MVFVFLGPPERLLLLSLLGHFFPSFFVVFIRDIG